MSEKEDSFMSSDSEDDDYPPNETSEDKETVKVNGFQVLPSQENLVKEMFSKHPNLTSNFHMKNQQLKNGYINVFLDLIETLCHSTKKLSWEDLYEADNTLLDLTRAGFKVGWLREELEEACLKKEKKRVSEARIRDIEEQIKKQKLSLSNLESDLEKEIDAALALAQ